MYEKRGDRDFLVTLIKIHVTLHHKYFEYILKNGIIQSNEYK